MKHWQYKSYLYFLHYSAIFALNHNRLDFSFLHAKIPTLLKDLGHSIVVKVDLGQLLLCPCKIEQVFAEFAKISRLY